MKRTTHPIKRKSQKGERFTADYIAYDTAFKTGQTLLEGSRPVIGFYILFAINTGLRVSDILTRKHSELLYLKPGDYLRLTEKKTKKYKEIQINHSIVAAYTKLCQRITSTPTDYVFKSQKGTVYATSSLNTILKEIFAGKAKNISTHSLRKSFGRHVYEKNGRSEDCLIMLSELFQHSSMAVTRRYLGIRREELGSIYMNL